MPNVIRGPGISDDTANAYGTQNRRTEYPAGHFLLIDAQGNRKFPYKDPKTGAIDCGLLRAAMSRAGQYKYPEVEKKAQALYQTHCAQKDKDLPIHVVKDFQGIILGVVASPDEPPDEAGHVLTKEAIEEMCWEYNKNFAVLKYRHGMGLTKDEAVILESYISPVDFELNGVKIKEGTWLQRIQLISQDLKDQVTSGLIKGLSLGGYIIDSEPID